VDGTSSQVGLEQAPPVGGRALVPSVDGAPVTGAERGGHLPEPVDSLVDLVRNRLAVGEIDVLPNAGAGTSDSGSVTKARPGAREGLIPTCELARGLRHEHVRQHMRKVADGREQAVMGGRVDRHRAGAERDDEVMEPLVQESRGSLQRREVPDRALEEVRARVLNARRLRPGHRMSADEALVVDGFDEALLGRPDVGHEAVLRRRSERSRHLVRERADRRAREAGGGALERPLDRLGGPVDGA
jgi:hypothetical protein